MYNYVEHMQSGHQSTDSTSKMSLPIKHSTTNFIELLALSSIICLNRSWQSFGKVLEEVLLGNALHAAVVHTEIKPIMKSSNKDIAYRHEGFR